MPLYDYRCTNCGATQEVFSTIAVETEEKAAFDAGLMHHNCPPQSGPNHMGVFKRWFDRAPAMRMPFEGHQNFSTGTYVSSMADLTSQLHRQSDEVSERTGIPHQFEPVDLRDESVAPPADSDPRDHGPSFVEKVEVGEKPDVDWNAKPRTEYLPTGI